MAERQRTEVSAELLEALRRRAEDQGRTEAEVLDEAVKRYLERPGTLSGLLDRMEQGRREWRRPPRDPSGDLSQPTLRKEYKLRINR